MPCEHAAAACTGEQTLTVTPTALDIPWTTGPNPGPTVDTCEVWLYCATDFEVSFRTGETPFTLLANQLHKVPIHLSSQPMLVSGSGTLAFMALGMFPVRS